MITEQAQTEGQAFRRRVKAELAMKGSTIKAFAHRIGYPPGTVSVALKKPWEFPLVVKAINKDLFPKEVAK